MKIISEMVVTFSTESFKAFSNFESGPYIIASKDFLKYRVIQMKLFVLYLKMYFQLHLTNKLKTNMTEDFSLKALV